MKTKHRVELHLHTNMSEFDGVSDIREYMEIAKRNGMTAIAVTDHAVVHNFPNAYQYAKNVGIKLIYGVEGYLVDDVADNIYHISILVKNRKGLKNLYKLISKSHIDFLCDKPLIPRSELINHREGLIFGSACADGELFKAILDGRTGSEIEDIASFYDYLEVQPIGNHKFLIDSGIFKDVNSLKDVNKRIISVGDALNKLVVVTGDVHYAYPKQKICREVVAKYSDIKENNLLSDLHLKSTDEMIEEFSYMGKEKAYEIVVENSNRIADLTEDELAPFPNVFYRPQIENADEKLKEMVQTGLLRLYGKNPPNHILERIERELEIIIHWGYSYLFVIAKELVDESNSKGYLVGSRGYTSASLVAFVSGITEINPLEPHYVCPECYYTEIHPEKLCGWDMKDKCCPVCGKNMNKDGFFIPMEVLFGADGDKVPDIGLNFSGEIHDDEINLIKELLGAEWAVVCGKVDFIPLNIAKHMVDNYSYENQTKFTEEEKIEISKSVSGVKRIAKSHQTSVFILPKHLNIMDITPLQKDNNDIITHFDYHDLLLQTFDVFVHNGPTILKKLYEATNYEPKNIPLDDSKTLNMICSCDTDGLTEFISDYSKNLLKKLKPKSFEELIRIVGLSHGTNVWTDNGEKLIEKGFNLNEIITCREDIMKYLSQKGISTKTAYSIMDVVRKGKALTREQKEIMLKNNVPKWYIESCSRIRYMLPRAHSAAYAAMAFRIAFYKAHFRMEFDKVIEKFM